ncbi:hypothetical protein MNBD_GAMMA12-1895 [hydrothermal vent metagenome]|uniref:DUF2909 domain-containing protein n=1 Tax=hydrothermal vent metagenome TaxID=652676 RepID=A0A3B0Z3P2_9ZZZZ
MVKMIIVLAFFAIVFSLGSAMFHLVSNKKGDPDKIKADSNNLFKSLAWRIGLSVSLFLFLIISYFAGWVKPEGSLIKIMEHNATQSTTQRPVTKETQKDPQ